MIHKVYEGMTRRRAFFFAIFDAVIAILIVVTRELSRPNERIEE